MKLKQILKSKKGIALENAILFMVIIFAFCALLTSLSLYGLSLTKLEKSTLTNKVALEQIGEDFLAGDTAETLNTNYESYTCEVANNTLTVKNTDGTVILYIVQDGKRVIQWRYSSPAE